MSIWFSLLYQPLVNALIFFYKILGENLGLAIMLLTIGLRAILIPLTKPSLEAGQKMRKLAPQLTKLKEKYKKDKKALAQAQLKLYQKNGVNPGAGCLPQIIQFIILIALFQAFNQVLRPDGEMLIKLNKILYPFLQMTKEINFRFLYLDLTKPDLISLPFQLNFGFFSLKQLPGIFLLLAAATQFLSSKLMMPAIKIEEKEAKKTEKKEDDMMAAMQSQMAYLMPLMTIFIGFRFPSGLVLYWFVFSLFMLIQQLMMKNKK